MQRKLFLSIGLAAVLLTLALIGSGCATFLAPQFTYQGRLTDAGGNPLNGVYTFTLQIYDDATAGTSLYTDSDVITVTDGLFDTVIGPTTVIAGLGPEDLAQPLWLEVEVSDGTNTETLEPRQRLYGAPYAFTLMPGAYISETMNETLHGAGGATAILNVVNSDGGDAPLPALRVAGQEGLELTGADAVDGSGPGASGSIYSGGSDVDSDLSLYSNDEVAVYLDQDNNSTSNFRVYNGATERVFRVAEDGNVFADGTFNPGGADYAEMMSSGETDLEPGDVLVVGPEGSMLRCSQANQSAVVGVYSTDPGFVAGNEVDENGDPVESGQVPLAVLGRVPVKASAENGSIQPGDLLVTSGTPGHAMKASDAPAVGTVIGKALEPLENGTGVVEMLVMLQ